MKTKITHAPDMIKARDRSKSETNFLSCSPEHVKELSNMVNGRKYYIHTYGCQANVRDEETMRGLLELVGYVRTAVPSEADVIILNTCAVRENAEDKVYGEIGNLKKLTHKNKEMVFAICGCVVEEPEILKYLMDKFPEINLYFGTHEIHYLIDMIYDVKTNQNRIVFIESKKGEGSKYTITLPLNIDREALKSSISAGDKSKNG